MLTVKFWRRCTDCKWAFKMYSRPYWFDCGRKEEGYRNLYGSTAQYIMVGTVRTVGR